MRSTPSRRPWTLPPGADVLGWVKDRWWLAAAVPTACGALFWVLAGGAAPWVQAQSALAREEVADALIALPGAVSRIDANAASLEAIVATERAILERLADISDDLASIKAEDTQVVDWAEGRTLELNDGRVCVPGRVCRVWFRARRTVAGADCRTIDATPYLLLPGEDLGTPVTFAPGWKPRNLTLAYKDFSVDFVVPEDITPGRRHFLAIAVYADCPFAGEGELVERPTMRVPITIAEPGAGADR